VASQFAADLADVLADTSSGRVARARRLIARMQKAGEDPPDALVALTGSRKMEQELETEDLERVEVLKVGAPIKAVGSPEGGEYVTKARLAQIAESTKKLLAQGWKAPNKIGHSKEQRLARALGYLPVEGDEPAVGWVTDVELSDDGQRLFADVRKVPRQLAKLIRAFAYRTRSVELSKAIDDDGEEHPFVVSGLAWMGAKKPAISTLGDVVALFEEEGALEQALKDEIIATVDLETDRPGKTDPPADTRAMADLTLNDEAQRKIAEVLGIEIKDDEPISEDKLLESAEALKAKAETLPDDGGGNGGGDGEGDAEVARKLEETENRVRELEETLRLEKREKVISAAEREGRFEPAKRKEFEDMYDKNAELTVRFLEELPVKEELVREFGAEETPDSDDERYLEDASSRLGVPKEALV
jgi:hypothetical protein